jgi:hypothetical protein
MKKIKINTKELNKPTNKKKKEKNSFQNSKHSRKKRK